MKFILYGFVYLQLMSSIGCGIAKKTSSSFPDDGRYKNTSPNKNRVFVHFEDSTVTLYPIVEKDGRLEADKTNPATYTFPLIKSSAESLTLLKSSFDIDIITIPFKYRFPTSGFPDQFNTNFCGALYTGVRNDLYRINYKKSMLGEFERKINHHGYGFGVFGGIGATAMNPWVTLNGIDIEYDGFIIMGGVQAAIALNNFTFGIASGIDHLMDKNRSLWIYRGKPWVGLAVGLNLN